MSGSIHVARASVHVKARVCVLHLPCGLRILRQMYAARRLIIRHRPGPGQAHSPGPHCYQHDDPETLQNDKCIDILASCNAMELYPYWLWRMQPVGLQQHRVDGGSLALHK